MLDLPTLKLPEPINLAKKTINKTWFFLYEATPFFLFGTFLLSILDITGSLTWLQNILSPVIVNFLGLPKEATNVFIMGLIRRDFGTAGLASLAGIGSGESILNTTQILVGTVVITLFVCVCYKTLMKHISYLCIPYNNSIISFKT